MTRTWRFAALMLPISLVALAVSSCAVAHDTTRDGKAPLSAEVATVAETCLAFSEAATEETNATAHFRLGTIQVDEYSARLQTAKTMFHGVPVDAETELGVAITEFREFLAQPGSDGLPFNVADNDYSRFRAHISMICDLAGETINIYMEPGTGG